MSLHHTAFDYLKPTVEQIQKMDILRTAAANYCSMLEAYLPEGPDKTFVIRAHRANAMWANVAITRTADGTPRV